jgi:hypothetical protein
MIVNMEKLKKHYWEMTEDDGLTSEQVKFNRHLHKLKVAKDKGKQLYFVTKNNEIIYI